MDRVRLPLRVYITARSRSNAALIRRLMSRSLSLRLFKQFDTLPPGMQDDPETDPNAECDSFRGREVPGECGQNFHQEKQQRNGNPQPGPHPHRYSLFPDPEGEACREPS